MSCNTGAIDTGFAQNLANKLNIEVLAATNFLWAWPSGKYIVAGKINSDTPDLNDKGTFKIFKPYRRPKK